LLEGPERMRWWSQLVGAYPSVAHYTRYAAREFPLVLLEPQERRASLSPDRTSRR
jgi:hypothetical protein